MTATLEILNTIFTPVLSTIITDYYCPQELLLYSSVLRQDASIIDYDATMSDLNQQLLNLEIYEIESYPNYPIELFAIHCIEWNNTHMIEYIMCNPHFSNKSDIFWNVILYGYIPKADLYAFNVVANLEIDKIILKVTTGEITFLHVKWLALILTHKNVKRLKRTIENSIQDQLQSMQFLTNINSRTVESV